MFKFFKQKSSQNHNNTPGELAANKKTIDIPDVTNSKNELILGEPGSGSKFILGYHMKEVLNKTQDKVVLITKEPTGFAATINTYKNTTADAELSQIDITLDTLTTKLNEQQLYEFYDALFNLICGKNLYTISQDDIYMYMLIQKYLLAEKMNFSELDCKLDTLCKEDNDENKEDNDEKVFAACELQNVIKQCRNYSIHIVRKMYGKQLIIYTPSTRTNPQLECLDNYMLYMWLMTEREAILKEEADNVRYYFDDFVVNSNGRSWDRNGVNSYVNWLENISNYFRDLGNMKNTSCIITLNNGNEYDTVKRLMYFVKNAERVHVTKIPYFSVMEMEKIFKHFNCKFSVDAMDYINSSLPECLVIENKKNYLWDSEMIKKEHRKIMEEMQHEFI